MNSEAAEAVAGSIGAKAVYGGGGVAVFGGLTSHDVIGLLGLAVAVVGFLLSWYYKRKADRRGELEHQARMRRLALGRRTDTDVMPLGDE
jgi:hypothetical protein